MLLSKLGICKAKVIHPVILVGIDYSSYFVSASMSGGGQYRVIAFIDEEPWSHRTVIHEGVVHYPSELLALVEKHKAVAVISFEGEGCELHPGAVEDLAKRKACYIQVPKSVTLAAEKLNYIHNQISASYPIG